MARSRDDRGLWKAARRGDFGKLRTILNAHPDPQAAVNSFHPTDGVTPIMVAARKKTGGHAVLVLIEYGADLDLVDQTKHHNTALHYAAYANRVAQVDYLLNAGANPFALNRRGHSPLDVARLRGRKEAAETLTVALNVHSGWLTVRSQSILPIWKRRWCVQMACNAERTVTELCVFQDPSSVHPDYVLQVDPPVRARQYSAVAEGDSLWMDRANAFKLEQAIRCQRTRHRRYRRDAATGRVQGFGVYLARDYTFSTDTETERDKWIQVLEGRPVDLFPLAVTQPPSPPLTVTVVSVNQMPATDDDTRARAATFSVEPPLSADFSEPSWRSGTSVPDLNSKFANFSLIESPLPPRASAPTFVEDHTDQGEELFSSSRNGFVIPPSSEVHDAFPVAAGVPIPSQEVASGASSEYAQPRDLPRRDCVVCMDAPRDAICVPCGHVAGCYSCLRVVVANTAECPICRVHVDSVVRIYDC